MNTIDFSELPHKKHNGKSVVDWKKLNGEKVYFTFEGVNGYFNIYYSHTVGKNRHKLKCVYKNEEKIYTPQSLKEMKINSLVKAFSSPLSKPTPENWLYQRTDLHKFVDNPEDLKNYHMGSGKTYEWKCPSCGKRFNKRILDVTQWGMSCDLCSSGFSKNERLVSIILTKINENYITQKEFSDCRIKQPLPFDFYLPQYNMVIETHGVQHYEEVKFYRTNEHTLKSDRIKKKYCKDNNIQYCEINCSSGKNIDTINQLKGIIKIDLTEQELKECMWESMHNTDGIDITLIQNLYDCYWSPREIEKHLNLNRGRAMSILKESGHNIRKERFSFDRSLVNLVTGELYGSIDDLKYKENITTNTGTLSYSLDRNGFIYNSNREKLCITRRKYLSINHDKTKMGKLYKETMKQLNIKKEDTFNKYVGKDVNFILDNSDNQKEDMLNLNNLPKNYFIKNNVIYKSDL